MAYSPTVFQLDCGYFPENKQVLGNWCQKCEGVTAMYKEDWVQILSSHDGMCRNITLGVTILKLQ